MSSKQKTILVVVAVFLVMSFLVFLTFKKYHDKKKAYDDAMASLTGTYASQSTTDPRNTTSAPSESDEPATSSTKREFTVSDNFMRDVHTGSEELSDYTISIDNKLLTFPCAYTTIKEQFTLYNLEQINGNMIPFSDDSVVFYDGLTVTAFPEKGSGAIFFTFSGDSYENAMCTQVDVSGSVFAEEQVMPVALKNGMAFGSNLSDVLRTFTLDYDKGHYYTFNGSDEEQIMKVYDGTNTYYFYGRNNNLIHFRFIYGEEVGDRNETHN